jgi:hypothetical protein
LRIPKYMRLVSKSREACLSAVETYNRASAMYREEAFAILMINAWELLLKARIMRENGGKVSCLYEFRPRRKKDGSASKLTEIKKTRSGAPMTIGLDRAYNLVAGYAQHRVDQPCIANIEALLEIRDSATHFVAPNALLKKTLTEISLASVRNYVIAAQQWFGVTFSDLNIASIPLSFDLDQKEVEAVAHKSSDAVVRFLAHMELLRTKASADESDFAFSVRVNFDLIKNKDDTAIKAAVVGTNPDLTISIEGDKVPAGFDWTYDILVAKLMYRYSDIKQNATFHAIMKPIKENAKFCYERYLNPTTKSGGRKSFFSPNVIKEFDAHYTRRSPTLFETREK